MTFFYLVFVSIIFFLSLKCLLKNYKERKRWDIIDKLPGPKRYPLVGTLWDLLLCPRRDMFNLYMTYIDAYKPLFRTWNGSAPEVHIMKPEHLEIVMNNIKHLNKGSIYQFLEPWFGRGLLNSTSAQWHIRRKMLTPAFHYKVLESYFNVFCDKSNKLLDKLMIKTDGTVFDIYPYITRCALDIICETAMGVEINALDQPNSEYVSAVHEIVELTIKRSHRPWLHSDIIFYNMSSLGKRYKHCLSVLHGFTEKVIRERSELYNSEYCRRKESNNEVKDTGQKKRMVFLDLLIEASQNELNFNKEDIRDEVNTFMFGGHDTTTAAICWSLFLLGNHQDVQNKLLDELDNIFQGEERPITLQDLRQMKYLECVIKESSRLYPSIPYISRMLTEDIILDEYKIPHGCTVHINIHDVHRDPTQFPNPEMFNPENFLPERCQHRHPFAYIPFSAGPRNCIGQKFAIMEEKIILASVIRKYKVYSVQKPTEITKFVEIILRPESGILVKLEPRK